MKPKVTIICSSCLDWEDTYFSSDYLAVIVCPECNRLIRPQLIPKELEEAFFDASYQILPKLENLSHKMKLLNNLQNKTYKKYLELIPIMKQPITITITPEISQVYGELTVAFNLSLKEIP
jgi:hypothetical protein